MSILPYEWYGEANLLVTNADGVREHERRVSRDMRYPAARAELLAQIQKLFPNQDVELSRQLEMDSYVEFIVNVDGQRSGHAFMEHKNGL